jgi:hypothetical protein
MTASPRGRWGPAKPPLRMYAGFALLAATRLRPCAITVPLLLLAARPGTGADWPQFRGPGRDGISPEEIRLEGWPEAGSPPVLWRASAGKGHAALSIRGRRGYTLGWDGKLDTARSDGTAGASGPSGRSSRRGSGSSSRRPMAGT